jgi:hypothetical protein
MTTKQRGTAKIISTSGYVADAVPNFKKRHAITEADDITISVIRGYLDDVMLRLGHHAVAPVVARLRDHYGVLVDRAECVIVSRATKKRRVVYILDDDGEPIRGDDDIG